MKRLDKDLQKIQDKKSSGVCINKLRSLGLIKKSINCTSSYLIPEGAPKWAAKFKFCRKKYGVTEHKEEKSTWILTQKGNKRLKNSKKDKKEEVEKSPEPTSEPTSEPVADKD